MTHVHRATCTIGSDDEVFNWASVDGEAWLPINRPAENTPEEAARIAALFDGDGNFKPLYFTRRWLEHAGATFEEVAP